MEIKEDNITYNYDCEYQALVASKVIDGISTALQRMHIDVEDCTAAIQALSDGYTAIKGYPEFTAGNISDKPLDKTA